MGSKMYKNKLCVYCAQRQSTTGDHVFAKEFFVRSQRSNLPQVPSCDSCNNEKSKLEHYLTTVFPFGGCHADAYENLVTLVPGRIAKNTRLHQDLSKSMSHIWSTEENAYRMELPIDSQKIQYLFEFITRGLAWYHWKTSLTDEHSIQTHFLTDSSWQLFEQRFFRINISDRVKENLGNGTVCYEGIRRAHCQTFTVWRYKMYGGLLLCGAPNDPNETYIGIGVFTGPRRIFHMV